MKTFANFLCVSVLAALLISCSEENQPITAETSKTEPTLNYPSEDNTADTESNQQVIQTEPEFIPDYISADDLHQRFKQNTIPFIFDVRGKVSFEKSHIETALSMPYGNTSDSDLAKVVQLDKSSEIVTYCGCPRHLSTLATQDLVERGYSNVKVLYEGYWHWKEQQFPVVESTTDTASTTEIKFQGILINSKEPVSGIDLFLQHARSGQLEAVRTDRQGRFKIDFHLYGYKDGDQFNAIVAYLDNKPTIRFSVDSNESEFLEIKM